MQKSMSNIQLQSGSKGSPLGSEIVPVWAGEVLLRLCARWRIRLFTRSGE